MSQKAKRKPNGGANSGGDASLEQIREILYGAQSRDAKEQFDRLHKQLKDAVNATQDQFGNQIKDMDARFKREIAGLKQALKAERAERAAALKALAGDLGQASTALNQSIAELDERLESNDGELRELLVNQLKAVAQKWESRQEELSAYVDEEFEDLRTNTADRTELSELFRELGQRVAGELKKPAPKA